MLMPRNSLVSGTLAAGNSTVVSPLLAPSFPFADSLPFTASLFSLQAVREVLEFLKEANFKVLMFSPQMLRAALLL